MAAHRFPKPSSLLDGHSVNSWVAGDAVSELGHCLRLEHLDKHGAVEVSSCDDSISAQPSRRQIVEIQLGGVMAHVVVRVGENLIESVITRRSAEEMKLKVGDTVSAIIKSTEVMLEKP